MDNKPAASSNWRDTFRALRHRNYQLFFSGQLISLIGTWMDQVAESWLVDIEHRTVTVFRDPGPEGYRSSVEVRDGALDM